MCNEIIQGIFTLVGVIIGVFLTLLIEICREHRELKKQLRHNAVKITQYIQNIQLTYRVIIKIFDNNFNEKDDEYINETKKCIHSNIGRIYPILSEFDTFLFVYLSKLTNSTLYTSYEESKAIIEGLYIDTQITESIFNRHDEVTKNMLTEKQKSKKYFTNAVLFLEKVEEEFMKLVKK